MRTNFYCQNICGEENFSIAEWNKTQAELELTNLTEQEKKDILFPPKCATQCFACMAVVGAQQAKRAQK